MKDTKRSGFLFFGIGLMLLLSTFSYTVLRDMQSALIVQKLNLDLIPKLKVMVVPLILIFGLLMLSFCRKGKIGRGFLLLFPLNTVIWGLLASYFQSEHSLLYGGMYVWSSVSMSLSVTLIWGYANQEFTFKKAAIQYPLLALIFPSSGALLGGHFFKQLSECNFSLSKIYLITLLTAMGASLLIFAIYLLLNSFRFDEKEQGGPVSWGYWLTFGLLLFGVKFSSTFPKMAFKMELHRLYPDPSSYMQFMAKYASISGWVSVGGSLIGVGLGAILYYRGAKDFFKVISFILLGMTIFGLSTVLIRSIGITMLSSVLYSGLMGAFIALRELAFFGIKKESRFTAKIVLDLILCSFAAIFGSTIITLTAVLMGNMNQNGNALIFFIAMVVCFVSLYRIRREMRKGIPRRENCR